MTWNIVRKEYQREYSLRMSVWTSCKIASLYVLRLWVVYPWLTHTHIDNFGLAILLAQPTEIKSTKQQNITQLSLHTSIHCFNTFCKTFLLMFTALHWTQGGLVRRKLFVCPSVKSVHCDKTGEISVQIFIPYERTFSLVFWEEEWLMGDPFYLKFWVNRRMSPNFNIEIAITRQRIV